MRASTNGAARMESLVSESEREKHVSTHHEEEQEEKEESSDAGAEDDRDSGDDALADAQSRASG